MEPNSTVSDSCGTPNKMFFILNNYTVRHHSHQIIVTMKMILPTNGISNVTFPLTDGKRQSSIAISLYEGTKTRSRQRYYMNSSINVIIIFYKLAENLILLRESSTNSLGVWKKKATLAMLAYLTYLSTLCFNQEQLRMGHISFLMSNY